MDIKARSKKRRERIKSHLSLSFEDAERWDLLFWQDQTPEARLSALVAIRKDIEKVNAVKEAEY